MPAALHSGCVLPFPSFHWCQLCGSEVCLRVLRPEQTHRVSQCDCKFPQSTFPCTQALKKVFVVLSVSAKGHLLRFSSPQNDNCPNLLTLNLVLFFFLLMNNMMNKNMFWRKCNQTVPTDFYSIFPQLFEAKWDHKHLGYQQSSFMFCKKSNSQMFQTTWGWVNGGYVFILGCTIPLRSSSYQQWSIYETWPQAHVAYKNLNVTPDLNLAHGEIKK